MTSRRDFLRVLLATPLAATLDVERLLWIPGQMVTVPRIGHRINFDEIFDEINEITLREILPLVRDKYFRYSPILSFLGAPIEPVLEYVPQRRLHR